MLSALYIHVHFVFKSVAQSRSILWQYFNIPETIWIIIRNNYTELSYESVAPSAAKSVADIGDHGLPILSVTSSPDELIVGRFFSCYEVIETVFCVFN